MGDMFGSSSFQQLLVAVTRQAHHKDDRLTATCITQGMFWLALPSKPTMHETIEITSLLQNMYATTASKMLSNS